MNPGQKLDEQDGLTPEPRPEPTPPARAAAWFLIPVVLLPLLMIAAGIAVNPTMWFALHTGNTYMLNLGYADTLVHADCGLIVYGDSVALTGLDMARISERTGLKSCNIAEFGGMTAVNGTLMVDRYLAHNARPRFIVFMFGPENFRTPTNWTKTSPFEALAWRLRGGWDRQVLHIVLTHPLDVLTWAEQGARISVQRVRAKPMGAESMNLRAPHGGTFPTPGTTLVTCETIKYEVPPDPQWVANLRAKYAVGGTQVILDANPSPPCDATLPYIQAHLNPYIDNHPYPVLPVNVFVDHSRNHVNALGERLLSDMIADQVLARMGGQPAAPARGEN